MEHSRNKLLSVCVGIRRRLTAILQWVVILLMAVLVLDVIWGVGTRYLLGQQAKWSEELARLLLVWVSVFGASVAFGMKAHLGLDYFAEKLHPHAGKFNRIVGAAITLTFAIVVFLVGGIALVKDTMESGQTMIALPLKKWWAYAALPVSGVFMSVILFEQLLESILTPAENQEGGQG